MTINDPTNSASRPFGRDALDALRYLLRNRFVILAIAAAAIGLALKFNWGWLVAAGIAPIILAAAPCAAMCALGLCMGGRGRTAASPDSTPGQPSQLAKPANGEADKSCCDHQ